MNLAAEITLDQTPDDLFYTAKPSRSKLGPMAKQHVRKLKSVMTQKQIGAVYQISVSTVSRTQRNK